MREGGWEQAPSGGDGEETRVRGTLAAGRVGDSDEGPNGETRGMCECETLGDAGWVSEGSTDLR